MSYVTSLRQPPTKPVASASSRAPTIAVACIAVAMLMLDMSVINTALSRIAAGLRTDLAGLQWVVDAYTIPLAAAVLTFGAIADRHGRRRVFAAGLGIFTLASAWCGGATGIGMLVAARAVQGLGAAMLFATALALIAQVSETEELRTKALAAFGATVGGAFALGPFVGGGLTELLGWRAIFLVNVPIGVVALLITVSRVHEGRDEHARPVDWPGQVALICGLFLLVFGLLRGNADGWGSAGIIVALTAAGSLLVVFVAIQRRSATAMLPLSLLRSARFAGAQVAVLGVSASFYALFLYVTIYLQSVLGLSPIRTGLVYLPGTVLMFVISACTAVFAQGVNPAKLAVAGLALTAVGIGAFVFAGVDSSWTILLPGVLICCIGSGIFQPASNALALGSLPEHQAGLAVGANDLFRQTGAAIGIAALGTLVPASARLGRDPQAYVTGLHHAVIVAAVVAALGAAATAALLIPRRQRVAEVAGERA
jgi:EmrB/QacA subfamily drug resistance transporter